MPDPIPNKQLSITIPLVIFIVSVIVFFIPILVGIQESHMPNAGEAGWGAIILGIVMWPLGLAFGIPALIILLKRLVQRKLGN